MNTIRLEPLLIGLAIILIYALSSCYTSDLHNRGYKVERVSGDTAYLRGGIIVIMPTQNVKAGDWVRMKRTTNLYKANVYSLTEND